MGNIFAGSEIIEMGIQIEKNGRDFYNALAGMTKDKEAKEAFRELAQQEEKHIDVFRRLLDSVRKYEPPEAYPGEYFSYMNALAGEYVFTQKETGKKEAARTKGCAKAIDLGIGFEKDSILFYGGMEEVVPEYDRELVHQLLKEEKKHLNRLYGLKRTCGR
jgi:rubrerythrin